MLRREIKNLKFNLPTTSLFVPPSSRSGGGDDGGGHDNYEDTDLDNIKYDDHDHSNTATAASNGDGDSEIGPLDAFMEGIHEEMKTAPSKAKETVEKYREDEEDDPMESYLRAKKDMGLTPASDGLRARYPPTVSAIEKEKEKNHPLEIINQEKRYDVKESQANIEKINYQGQLSHPNLVKLVGYCLEDEHRLLVYEFMQLGKSSIQE
ncbi:hypothetical protein RJ640_003059 [Escallonia rubra]|uniref:Serine-threonine/tyrosine-protein kinase catalytic domain-containing protein n=1 Tax=Escallonia rubra TaxID=112253 RepID=A0AA88QW58_9ASTE|nr:hypothetical protein RJ640_003059 [Escallonia rubra]